MRMACVAMALLMTALTAGTTSADDGWVDLFDGKTLTNWDGNPKFWSVQEGVITGQTTADNPTNGNTFLIYRGDKIDGGSEVGNFELELDYKIVGGNSGIQYRSFEVPNEKWVVGGYQADIDSGTTYSGINYGERFRGILANRGQRTVIGSNHAPTVQEQFADSDKLQSAVHNEKWNHYRVVSSGFTFEHFINNSLMSACTDEDAEQRRASGVLALQLHAGPPMTVQFKNIKLRVLKGQQTSSTTKKQVLLLAGARSHGFGSHDHTAGCALLAKLINASGLPVAAQVHSLEQAGWPSAETLAAANTIVIYSDGGGGHPFNAHLDELHALTKQGTGIVCIHYGVEIPKGDAGNALLNWTGGYFEAHWSVNPHWTAKFTDLPQHPVTTGVQPFSTNDEWYYHMRFREDMAGVQPILTDIPTAETLTRPDGPHSGNPAVRASVAAKTPQHVAWATQRADGGRGFGCTGGHYHWNWGNNQFRKLMLNAIVWTAGLDVPAEGVNAGSISVEDLLQDHDESVPADFNKGQIQAMLDEWNR